MRVIARSTLTRFLVQQERRKDYCGIKSALDAWFREARQAAWKNSAEVKASYMNASIVGADRVVFNFKGNSYRLVVAADYGRGIVFAKWVGSHADYDAIDVRTVSYAAETD